MSAEHVASYAKQFADRQALIVNGTVFSYGVLHGLLKKLSVALARFCLPVQSWVAIGCEDQALALMLHLAARHLGLVTVSFSPKEDPEWREITASCQLVLCDRAIGMPAQTRWQLVDGAWLGAVLALPEASEMPAVTTSAESPAHLMRTSGTTGKPKWAILSRHKLALRIAERATLLGIGGSTRYAVIMRMTVTHVHVAACACLEAGATVIFESRLPFHQAAVDWNISHVTVLPLHLRRMLDAMPADAPRPSGLFINSIGGPVPLALYEEARMRLADALQIGYGINEAGAIAIDRANGGADIVAGVSVQVVDDFDRLLLPGQVGQVRIRSQAMVEGYYDDPRSTALMFRNGWFYPGDAAYVDDAGRLHLMGRSDDLLNLGGIKLAADRLEAAICEATGITEVAVCAFGKRGQSDEIWVVTRVPIEDNPALREAMSRVAGIKIDAIRTLTLAALPRTANGKLQRAHIRLAIAEQNGAG